MRLVAIDRFGMLLVTVLLTAVDRMHALISVNLRVCIKCFRPVHFALP